MAGPGRWGSGSFLALLLGLLLLALPRGGADPLRSPAAPLHFNVSLDSPPESRWAPVAQHFDPPSMRIMLNKIIDSAIPKWVHAIIRPLAEDLESFIPQPYEGEIRGLAKHFGVSVGDELLLNLAYEFTAFCTSIVAQDKQGNIYHGRNLDYAFGEYLRNVTIEVDFIKNGQIKFRGTTFFGYVGIWTGQSPHKFSISGNERGKTNALSEAEDFETAFYMLAKMPIIADVYYIIGGTTSKQGAVITRKRTGPVDIWPLDPLNGALTIYTTLMSNADPDKYQTFIWPPE
ncbi:putative N-acylethanolamine-hydrolyzing acid amidase protein [Naja naja]|nr:putative N-acylethanolamine-hydrolyzing acid amidase protein [Naja naja]